MSYEKHTWETGETITAEKLNNLEDGVASGGGGGNETFVVTFELDYDDTRTGSWWAATADKTFMEIQQAIVTNKNIIAKAKEEDSPILYLELSSFEEYTDETPGDISFLTSYASSPRLSIGLAFQNDQELIFVSEIN